MERRVNSDDGCELELSDVSFELELEHNTDRYQFQTPIALDGVVVQEDGQEVNVWVLLCDGSLHVLDFELHEIKSMLQLDGEPDDGEPWEFQSRPVFCAL